MKAQLVKESISDFLKPKSKEDLLKDPLYKKAGEFMTKIFSDLHKDPNDPYIYINSKGKWMFEHDLKRGYIYVNYDRIWSYFYNNITSKYNIVKLLLKICLKEITIWLQLPLVID